MKTTITTTKSKVACLQGLFFAVHRVDLFSDNCSHKFNSRLLTHFFLPVFLWFSEEKNNLFNFFIWCYFSRTEDKKYICYIIYSLVTGQLRLVLRWSVSWFRKPGDCKLYPWRHTCTEEFDGVITSCSQR